MIAELAALLLAAQPAPPGWADRAMTNATAYEKGDSLVVLLEPRAMTPQRAIELGRTAAAGIPGCASVGAAEVRQGEGGVWMAMAPTQDRMCAFLAVTLPDERVQLGVVVAPGLGVDAGAGFKEAATVFAQAAEMRAGWVRTGGVQPGMTVSDAGGVRPYEGAGASGPAGVAPVGAAPAGTVEQTLAAAAAAVPGANKPLYAVTHGYGTHVGWPPSFIYRVFPVYLFEGGRGHDCHGADPMRLDWAAIAASEDCDLYEWRLQGDEVAFREVGDEAWETKSAEAALADRFGANERVDVRFENRGGVGVDYGAGSIPVSTLTGKNLVLTSNGRVVMTGYSDTLAANSAVTAYSGNETPPIQGAYRLDGNVITMLPDGQARPVQAYVSGDRREGRMEHVFLGGTHYWRPDD